MQRLTTSGAGTNGGGPCDGCAGELGKVADSAGGDDAGLDGVVSPGGEAGCVLGVPGAEDDGGVVPGCWEDSGGGLTVYVLLSTHLVQTVCVLVMTTVETVGTISIEVVPALV